MSDWGRALAGGIAAAAKSGSDALGQQINMQAQADAEKRAADTRLATQERLMAIEHAMKMRGVERFSKVVQAKMAGSPLQIAPGDPAPMNNEDMMVKPSADDAAQAALNETMATDPEAYIAGTGMLGSAMKDKAEVRKLEAREKMERARIESNEKIKQAEADQRERASERRVEAMMAGFASRERAAETRANAGGGRGGAVKETAAERNSRLLTEMGVPKDQVVDYVLGRKQFPTAEVATKIYNASKKNMEDITPQQAAAQAQAMADAVKAANRPAGAAKPTSQAINALPAGAKQIGTSGGKPVYQTPDGKKFIQG